MQSGETIWVRAFKHDGHCYRWWSTTVESASAAGVVTRCAPSGWVYQPERNWQRRFVVRTHYWFQRPYILLELYREDNTLLELYAHVNSQPRWVDGELHYEDYELDAVLRPGKDPRIIDQDEFEAAAQLYGYTQEFQRACYRHAQEAASLLGEWYQRMQANGGTYLSSPD